MTCTLRRRLPAVIAATAMAATTLTVLATPAVAQAAGFADSLVQQIVLAEMTGDGKPDLVFGNTITNNELWVHPGDGKGNVYPAFKVGNGWSGRIYAAGDYDRDGRQDLIRRASDGKLWLYRVTGYGGDCPKFAAKQMGGGGWAAFQIAVPGDVTGDGYPDIIGVAADGAMYLFANTQKLDIKAGVRIGGGGWGAFKIFPSGVLNGGSGPVGLLALDTKNGKLHHYTFAYSNNTTTIKYAGEVSSSGWSNVQNSFVNHPLFTSGYNMDNSAGTEIVTKRGSEWWVYHRVGNSWTATRFNQVPKPTDLVFTGPITATPQTNGKTWEFSATTNIRADSVTISYYDYADTPDNPGVVKMTRVGGETWTATRTLTGWGRTYTATIEAKYGNQQPVKRRISVTVVNPLPTKRPTNQPFAELETLAKKFGVELLYAKGATYGYDRNGWSDHLGVTAYHSTQVNIRPTGTTAAAKAQDTGTFLHEVAHVEIFRRCGFDFSSNNIEKITDVYAMEHLGMKHYYAHYFNGNGNAATQTQKNQAAAIRNLPAVFTDPQLTAEEAGKPVPAACTNIG